MTMLESVILSARDELSHNDKARYVRDLTNGMVHWVLVFKALGRNTQRRNDRTIQESL